MSYNDKMFCGSIGCTNKCGRKLSIEDLNRLPKWEQIAYAYFCTTLQRPEVSMKKPTRTYIASPYSPTEFVTKLPFISKIVRTLRARQVTKTTAILMETYNIAPICPITQSHQIAKFLKNKDGGFKKWKEVDFSYINGCDQIYVIMMKGWKYSVGVQEEIKYARRKNLAIFYFDIYGILKAQE